MDLDEDLVMVDSDVPLPLPLQASASASASLSSSPSPPRERARTTHRVKRQISKSTKSRRQDAAMKPNVVVDEMFPEGAGPYMDIDEAGGSSGLLMDLAANEKSVHTDFFNQFDDLYDDEDLS